MATNMDKSLYRAPAGIDQLDDGEPELEIEIVDPEEVTIKGPGFELEITEDGEGVDFNDNLAEEMDASDLQSLAEDLASDIDNDKMSRKDWEDTYKNGLTLLGLK